MSNIKTQTNMRLGLMYVTVNMIIDLSSTFHIANSTTM